MRRTLPPHLLPPPPPVKKDMIPRPGRCFCSVMLLNSLLIDKNRAENVKLIHGKTTGRVCVSLARPVLPAPITSKRMPRRLAKHTNARQNHYPRRRAYSEHALSGL